MADGSPRTALVTDLRPAFAALYRQHVPMVRRALRQLGVPPASLDDATQDVFVVLHRRLDDFEPGRSLTNWLWGIARGVASGHRRSARRRARLHEALPRPDATDPLERGMARREANVILDDFLGSLDADKCAVFVMSEIEGRRGPEIAEQLDVNLNTVYARLRAARKRFDAAMERHRSPRSRPMFAWLPFTWPAWLGKPVVAVGAGALVTAVAIGQPMSEPPAAPSEPIALATVADAEVPAFESPSVVVPTARRAWRHETEPAVVLEIDDEDDEVIVLDEPSPSPSRRHQPAPAAVVVAESLDESAEVEMASPELVMGPPPRAPWSSRVQGHRPVHHPELVQPRSDFIDELLRVALRI